MNTTVMIVVAVIVVLLIIDTTYKWYLTQRCPNCANYLHAIVIFDRQGGDHFYKCSGCQAEFRLRCYVLTTKTESGTTNNFTES